jgi:hypothetical protein
VRSGGGVHFCIIGGVLVSHVIGHSRGCTQYSCIPVPSYWLDVLGTAGLISDAFALA